MKDQTEPLPEAPVELLPRLLVAPPWVGERVPREVVCLDVAVDAKTRVVWAPGERERFAAESARFDPGGTPAAWAVQVAAVQRWDGRAVAEAVAYAPEELAAPLFEEWDGGAVDRDAARMRARLQAVLVRFGDAGGAKITGSLRRDLRFGDLLLPIVSQEAARLAAHWFTNLKAVRGHGAAWLDRNGVDAVAYLVPDALGRNKSTRIPAERAILRITAAHGRDAVLAAVAESAVTESGGEAARAIGLLLDADPDMIEPDRIPRPGPWLDLAALPQVRLRGSEVALPAGAVGHLVTVLAIRGPEAPVAIEAVAEAFDRSSLRDFGWALFEQWLKGGSPKSDEWTLTGLGEFGDDATVAALAPLIRVWPGQSRHHRAVTGLGVLARIGTENALRALQDIAEKVKFRALKAEAGHHVKRIAYRLGLDADQLADRLLPDFGLAGPLVLDYGPRRFHVVLDAQLKPEVRDEDGKPRKSLPRPGAKDDPDLAPAAYQRFAALKKELRTVAADALRRFEGAMVGGRVWTREEFGRSVLGHPLLRVLGARLVWIAETPEGAVAFRIAEDGTLSDVDESVVELGEGDVVGLAHPVRLSARQREDWARVLADYELLQPFPQIQRPVFAFTEEESDTGRIARYEGLTVEAGHLLGLTSRGWVRGVPLDNGAQRDLKYAFPKGGSLVVELDPGLPIGAGGAGPPQTLRSVRLAERSGETGGRGFDIDPVAASEALASLDRLVGLR